MESAAVFIKEVGFPIFVAIYIMVQQSKVLKELTAGLQDIKQVMMLCKGNSPAEKIRFKRRGKY